MEQQTKEERNLQVGEESVEELEDQEQQTPENWKEQIGMEESYEIPDEIDDQEQETTITKQQQIGFDMNIPFRLLEGMKEQLIKNHVICKMKYIKYSPYKGIKFKKRWKKWK